MSSINDLKENATNDESRVNITSRPQRHKVVLPANMEASDERINVDLTAEFPKEKVKPENIHESQAKDILVGEDSPFEKYKAKKLEEYKERMATLEQEEQLKEDEEELVSSDEAEVEFGTETLYDATKPQEVVEIGNVTVMEEDTSILTSVEHVDEASAEEDVEESVVVESEKDDSKTKVENKKEVVESPDIDLSVTKVDNLLEDLVEEEDESTNTVDQDEVLEHLQKLATERLKPVSRELNISSFTILKKPTANTKVLEQPVKAAKWVLPTQESIVLMKEFLGSELETLREFSEDGTSVTQLYRKYKTIYDHIASPKPATYEAWLKSTPYSDIDHYFFAVYIASFKDANYLPLDCRNKGCEKTFLTEDVPIMNMVKFETEKDKEKFVSLYQSESTPAGKGIYCSEIVPLSNNIAVGFKDASIYNLFELASLNDKDKEKYASILEFIPYIDSLYIIHMDRQELEPVGYKIYPDNANKTTKSKINTFHNVLKNLSVDEFTPIRSYIKSITNKSTGMSYIYPAIDCPYCGKPTTETNTTAEELVFLRYQLASLSSMPLK